MRLKICEINVEWPNGTIVLPGALKAGDDPVDVTIGFGHSTVIGKATNFSEEDGAIWADIEINAEMVERFSGLSDERLKDWEPVTTISHYTMDTTEDTPKVTDGILRVITMVAPSVPAFPKEKE